ncbi:MAG: hypothetical protein IKB90_01315 [Alistipes sp.]|nr:hypothetical protein [Alistipes sp.]
MNIVEEVIVEYLRSNRRLVIPNFGAFMAKESGERIFSGLLRTDDGVLSSLLKARGLNEMEAAITIDRFIFEVRHELEQYGYCRLGEVGTLRIEPETKALRLYPPVHGELPKQTPYVPKQVSETESGKRKTENEKSEFEDESKSVGGEKETPNASNAPNAPKKPRKKVDFVMVVAVIILLVALLGIGYGWYVSNLGVADDDAAMDALRVAPELINE